MDDNVLLPTLVYGCEKPEIRFRMHEGRQLVFCLRNGNLHLTQENLDYDTYETGAFLGALCKEHCLPKRVGTSRAQPSSIATGSASRIRASRTSRCTPSRSGISVRASRSCSRSRWTQEGRVLPAFVP